MQLTCRVAATACLLLSLAVAQQPATLITQGDQPGERGTLGFGTWNVTGASAEGSRFVGTAMAFDYALCGWCNLELYLTHQKTAHDTLVFSGFRWQGRFPLARGRHRINPALHLAFEDINGADVGLLDVVGNDCRGDVLDSKAEARRTRERGVETRFILGGSLKDWSVAWNFVAHRSLAAREPFEFGYAVGGTRPLVRERRGTECAFCAGSLQAGVEVYGGLGTQRHFGLAGTSQYVAPLLAWSPPNGMTLQVSPGFGLTGSSLPFLLRVGVSWEVARLGQLLREKRLRHSPPHPKDLDRTQ